MVYVVFSRYEMGACVGKLIMMCKTVDAESYDNITTKQYIKIMIGHIFNLSS